MARANDAYWTLNATLANDPPALAALAEVRDAMNHLVDLLNQDV